jgi:glucose/arabinose dehydrogenase
VSFRSTHAFVIALSVAALAMISAPSRGAPAGERPEAIGAQLIVGGLNDPAAFTIAPDGRIFYGEHATGQIRIYDPSGATNTLFVTITNLSTEGDQGVLGIVLNPSYPAKPFVYVYASRLVQGTERNQILRFTDVGGTGTNQKVLFTEDVVANGFHQGGRVLFGLDGMLYTVVGDADDPANSQDLSHTSGKFLRLTPAGKVPPDNPFPGSLIWAFGLRNSFGFTFDPLTGRLWEGEDGPECNDEVNRIRKAGNYAWGPSETCSTPPPPPKNTNQDGPNRILPATFFPSSVTPVGMAFCSGCGLPDSEGTLFMGEFNNGRIVRFTMTMDRKGIGSMTIAYKTGTPAGVLSMEVGPDHALYFSSETAIYKLVPA